MCYVCHGPKVAGTDSLQSTPSLTAALKCSNGRKHTKCASAELCGGIRVQAQNFCEIFTSVIKFTFTLWHIDIWFSILKQCFERPLKVVMIQSRYIVVFFPVVLCTPSNITFIQSYSHTLPQITLRRQGCLSAVKVWPVTLKQSKTSSTGEH